jgi:hypothetical protein
MRREEFMKKHKKHHSDPIVGGESEKEGRAWGRGEHANMPKETKMKDYPKANQMGPTVEDDTMGRIDKENSQAKRQSHRYTSNQH